MKFKKKVEHVKLQNPRKPKAQERKDSVINFLFFTGPEILHFTLEI